MVHAQRIAIPQPAQDIHYTPGAEQYSHLTVVVDNIHHLFRKLGLDGLGYRTLLHRNSSAIIFCFNLRKPSNRASGLGGQPGI